MHLHVKCYLFIKYIKDVMLAELELHPESLLSAACSDVHKEESFIIIRDGLQLHQTAAVAYFLFTT